MVTLIGWDQDALKSKKTAVGQLHACFAAGLFFDRCEPSHQRLVRLHVVGLARLTEKTLLFCKTSAIKLDESAHFAFPICNSSRPVSC